MDIFIKSFNRPYYLEKCIFSIKSYITGNYRIVILDDGTDEIYLNKITNLFKDVTIIKSPYYQEKVKKIKQFLTNSNERMPKLKIPTKFWSDQIGKGSDYFLLLEDDMWFTSEVDINDIGNDMKLHNLSLVKTSLFNNVRMEKYTGASLNQYLNQINSNLSLFNVFLFKKIYSENFLHSLSILQRLRLVDIKTVFPLYAKYAVAGCFYEKEYYKYIWEGYEGYVNEDHQLFNVLKWNKNNPEKAYAILKKSSLKTSFTSSATNKFEGVNLDPFVYNDVLNRSWLEGKFIVKNSVKDFEESTIKDILVAEDTPLAKFEDWKLWSERFKAQYEF